jgi:hypothetical protein
VKARKGDGFCRHAGVIIIDDKRVVFASEDTGKTRPAYGTITSGAEKL